MFYTWAEVADFISSLTPAQRQMEAMIFVSSEGSLAYPILDMSEVTEGHRLDGSLNVGHPYLEIED